MARGHKSTKIPGVRLRPAPAQDSSRADAQAASSSKRKRPGDDEADDGEEVGVEAMNAVSRPFKGAVVCFTGVQDKPALAAMAKELGAIVESNLTDTATHLVASDFASEKYKVALELGFEIVDDDWIRASHMVWRDGGEVSLKESVEGHHLPIFQGLRFCMSGFELGEKRSRLIKGIEAQGGYISRTLDRTCTHLVTLTDSSDKVTWAQSANQELTMAIVSNKPLRTVRYVEKVMSADGKGMREVERERDQTDIHIVWEEWVLDCLEARGRWREEGYTIDVPRDKIKRQVIKKLEPSRTLRALDSTIGLPIETSSGDPDASLRKAIPSPLRRMPTEISMASSATVTTAAGDDAEPAILKRLRRSTSSFDTGRSAAVEVDGHEVLLNEILDGVDLPLSQASARGKSRMRAVETLDDGPADDMPDSRAASLQRRSSAGSSTTVTTATSAATAVARSKNGVASISRSTSFSARQPNLPKNLSASSLHPSSLLGYVPSPILEEAKPRSSEGSSLPREKGGQPFAGLRFLNRCGKGRTKREVAGAVQYLGGSILGDDPRTWAGGADYIVCKFRAGRPQPVPQLANWSTTKIVSQHWVENCYRADALLDVDSSVVHRPLEIRLPVPGASSVRLCPTKLDFNEQEFARVLIEAFGGEFVGGLTRSVTHLICSPSDISGDKYTHAVNWNIPVLDPRWLAETARMGRFPELDSFHLGASKAKDSINRGPPVGPAVLDSPPLMSPAPERQVRAPTKVARESLEQPAIASAAIRAINEAEPAPSLVAEARSEAPAKAQSTSPIKAAAPTALAPKPARSLPAPAPAAATSPDAEAPVKVRSRTSDAHTPVPAARSKSDVLPSLAVGRSASASNDSRISPRPPAIAADVRAYIDQLEQEKRRASPVALAAAAGAFDDRPTKRKRVLGRQGTTVGPNDSPSTGSGTSGTTAQPSGPTSPASVIAPPMPPSSIAPPNSPPAHSSDSYPHPGDESQPLRVNWDDPDARRAKQRILDSLARGAAAKRGEDVACIGAEYEEEILRVEQERESERLARELAERDKERGERRASTRRSSARA